MNLSSANPSSNASATTCPLHTTQLGAANKPQQAKTQTELTPKNKATGKNIPAVIDQFHEDAGNSGYYNLDAPDQIAQTPHGTVVAGAVRSRNDGQVEEIAITNYDEKKLEELTPEEFFSKLSEAQAKPQQDIALPYKLNIDRQELLQLAKKENINLTKEALNDPNQKAIIRDLILKLKPELEKIFSELEKSQKTFYISFQQDEKYLNLLTLSPKVKAFSELTNKEIKQAINTQATDNSAIVFSFASPVLVSEVIDFLKTKGVSLKRYSDLLKPENATLVREEFIKEKHPTAYDLIQSFSKSKKPLYLAAGNDPLSVNLLAFTPGANVVASVDPSGKKLSAGSSLVFNCHAPAEVSFTSTGIGFDVNGDGVEDFTSSEAGALGKDKKTGSEFKGTSFAAPIVAGADAKAGRIRRGGVLVS